jgi:ribonuclease P protein component
VAVAGSNAFPKDFRLRNAAEFRKVYDGGAKRVSRSFVLFALSNGLEYSRFGLTTPRKIGKAHERNRVKRRVREILRTSLTVIPSGFDFVLNPRQSVNERDFEELRDELIALLGAEQ